MKFPFDRETIVGFLSALLISVTVAGLIVGGFGGFFYALSIQTTTNIKNYNQVEIQINQTLPVVNATINDPDVTIHITTLQGFLTEAKQINATIVYTDGVQSFTVITSDWTIGYQYQSPQGSHPVWWIWG